MLSCLIFFGNYTDNHLYFTCIILPGSDDGKGIEVKRTVGLLSGIAFIVGSIIGNVMITPNEAELYSI